MKNKLTKTQIKVLEKVAVGIPTKEIAAQLGITENTVSVHRSNIIKRLGIHNIAQLTIFAIKNGIIKI